MNEVIDFLNKAGVYFLATVDADQPRVRPLGFVMACDGKLAFGTNNRKDMYKQMMANPKIEIACYDGAGNTLRINGTAAFITSERTQRMALEVMPALVGMYAVGDGVFEIFCINDAKATCASMSGESRTLAL